MKRSLFAILTSTLLLSFVSGNTMADQYYKWVDAKGVTHYTKTPPPKNAKKAGKVETYGWKNSAPTSPRSTDPVEQTENLSQGQQQQSPQAPADQDQQQREANEALQQSKNRAVAL
ncbi:DUF4124 domain-containing protein [Acinetobacter sp. ASP199]|uniref:DUF4124 domain-containing protein n=1 Tax=unclassified Acinetobacter TaxID=196816 RepID=UPI001F619589|nr:DUF4124 domain-containing protein [Acinetobacter sp. ASP199]UNT59701.1 DUF4124 domain-containing protein [Acinetobacter sp. ASP199]